MSHSPKARALLRFALLASGVLCGAWYLSDASRPTRPRGVQATSQGEAKVTVDETGELAALSTSAHRTESITPVVPAAGESVLATSSPDEAWTLHGIVVDDRGRPIPGALMGLTELQRGAPAPSGGRSHVLADAQGSFELLVPDWARGESHLLCARSEGWRPDSRVTTVDLALTRQSLRMTLGAGHSITGVVLAGGEPVPGASISIDAAYGTAGVFGMGREAWWVEGQLFEKHGTTTSDAQGRFEVHGLGPYGHWLRIHPAQGEALTLGHFTFHDVVPGDRVFDVSHATLSVTVEGPGDSAERPMVKVSMASGTVEAPATSTPLLLHVPPDEQVTLVVSHPEASPVARTLAPLPPNLTEHVHVLLEWIERPSLTVYLPGATAAGVDEIDLRAMPIGSQNVTTLKATAGPGPDTFRVVTVPCAPGRVQLCLGPREHSGVEAYIKPQIQIIALPEKGDVHVEFTLEFRGRCKVQVESPLSSAWSATATLISPTGRALRTLHFDMDPGAEWGMSSWSSEIGFGFGGIEQANPAGRHIYPAGAYTYRIESPEHRPWSQQVTIRTGKTAGVTAVLVPL